MYIADFSFTDYLYAFLSGAGSNIDLLLNSFAVPMALLYNTYGIVAVYMRIG